VQRSLAPGAIQILPNWHGEHASQVGSRDLVPDLRLATHLAAESADSRDFMGVSGTSLPQAQTWQELHHRHSAGSL
jgi:hypothetical protein